MAKDCGPTPSAELLTKNIEGAKGEIDGLIGDSLGGLADSNVNIKDKISGLTDGIGADLEGFAPDIPEPQFSLQGQMENLLNNTDNPGAMVQQMDEIKAKFGDKVNVDQMFDEFGMDSKELKQLDTDYKSKLKEATALQELQNKGAGLKDSVSQDLIAMAQGDTSAISKLVGGATDKIFSKGQGKDDLLQKVCSSIPNLEMDALGNVIEKGPLTQQPTKDAEADTDTVDVKAEVTPEVLDTSSTIITDLIGDASDVPPEDIDVETFDFAPPIDPEEIAREDFDEDTELLATVQEKLRQERSDYINGRTGRDRRDDLYLQTAIMFTIDAISNNINIKYNILNAENPKILEGTKFKVRGKNFKMKKPKVEDVKFVIDGPTFKRTYRQPPFKKESQTPEKDSPKAINSDLRAMIDIVLDLEYVEFLGDPFA